MRLPARLPAAAVLAVVVAATGACPGGVEGQVDDEDVPAMMSAYFIQRDEVDDVFGVSAGMVSLPNGCDGATARQEAFNDAYATMLNDLEDNPEDAEDIQEAFSDTVVAYEEDNLPSDYWTVGVAINVEDDGDVEDKFDIEDDAGKVSVSVCRVNDHPRTANKLLRRDEDCFVAEAGDVDVTAYEKDGSFAFTAEVDLVWALDPTREAGDVVITGTASYCEGLESAADELAEIIADAAGG